MQMDSRLGEQRLETLDLVHGLTPHLSPLQRVFVCKEETVG